MTRSRIRIFYHFVWATKNRELLLDAQHERAAHRLIEALAIEKKCVVRALNGMPDHVHLVVQAPATISASELMHHTKGVSSSGLNETEFPLHNFGWQEGYGVFSLSQRDLKEVISYVENQKAHHAENKLKPSLEDPNEEVAR